MDGYKEGEEEMDEGIKTRAEAEELTSTFIGIRGRDAEIMVPEAN